jgi:hypothetical protein
VIAKNSASNNSHKLATLKKDKIKSIAAFRVFLAITNIAELATKQKPNT